MGGGCGGPGAAAEAVVCKRMAGRSGRVLEIRGDELGIVSGEGTPPVTAAL